VAGRLDVRTANWRASPPSWRLNAPLGFVLPCEPTLVDHPPSGPGWLHEIKHYGFRVLALNDGERLKVWSRRGADFTDRFAKMAEAVGGLHCAEALIDGEAVVLRADGRSDFHALLTTEGGAEASLVAFDLLRLDGDDMRERPIEARREALARLVSSAEGIVFNEALAVDGAVVFKKACDLGLEGIVSKRAGSRYRSGRSRTWLKTKNPEFVRT
jgi:bifunctional non-homologous end joining protein LigD